MNALNRLRRERGLQLFVVFVHSFSGTPAQQWTDTTAQRSDLGRRDGLLAVATRDRSYAYSFDKAFPLADDQLDEVANMAIEPALAQNDWAGAVVGAADGYRAVLAGRPVPTPKIVPGQPDTGGGLGGVAGRVGVSACLLGLAVAVGLGGWLWRPASRIERVLATAAGLLLFYADARTDALGFGLCLVVVALHLIRARAAPKPAV
jgi:uncharacterized membrane protein YgcG